MHGHPTALFAQAHRIRTRGVPSADPTALVAVLSFLALVAVALFGARIAPFEPIYFVVEHGADPRPYEPGLVFPLGSDVLGRDLISLVLAGARATLTIVLIAGLARVTAGLLAAALGTWWRRGTVAIDSLADLVGAVPATLVALLLIKAFVKTDTSVAVVVAALLLTGWAGPYRVIRAELDRVARSAFSEGARAIGVSPWRLFWRHQFPHLAPVLAVNLSQQVVASLVLVAELGVLGVIVSPVRAIDIQESLSVVRTGPPMSANVPDVPEWGAMLSSARTTEILWVTRWAILVPGAAFALTAIAVALLGFALARRYARRDVLADGPAAGALAVLVAMLCVASALVPERYAEASGWATAARAAVRDETSAAAALAGAGLALRAVTSEVRAVQRAGPATVSVAGTTLTESDPLPSGATTVHLRSLVSASLGGGGTVDAPVVFAGRGISKNDAIRPPAYSRQRDPRSQLVPYIADYPDDYAGIDVHGKVVVLARFLGIDAGRAGFIEGFPVATSIDDAIRRGAAAVLFVDPFASDAGSRNANPYVDLERQDPADTTAGVPVIVLDRVAAHSLLTPLGIDIEPFLGYDPVSSLPAQSASRDLDVSAHVSVPLRETSRTSTSLIADVPVISPDAGRIVVWASRTGDDLEAPRAKALGALGRLAVSRRLPFVFVAADASADSRAVQHALGDQRIALVLVLGRLDRDSLRFTTANGDLIPAMDLYAQRAGARYEVTRTTATIEQVTTPLPGHKTVVIDSVGDTGAASGDAVGTIGYLAGRYVLRAPELSR